MKPHPDEAGWKAIEGNAHLPEVQERIREEIRKGTIRVVPNPEGGIRIIPTCSERPSPAPGDLPGRCSPDAKLGVG